MFSLKSAIAGLALCFCAVAAGRADAALVSATLLSGNDKNQQALVASTLGVDPADLVLFEASDESPSVLTGSFSGKSGTWSTGSTLIDAVAVKAGPNFLLMSYVGMPTTGGDWCTDATCSPIDGVIIPVVPAGNGINPANLSHFTAYQVVPLPAAAWMMLAGLGGLGIWRRAKLAPV